LLPSFSGASFLQALWSPALLTENQKSVNHDDMKTTLDIDDDLYRRIKAKAALEGRKVTALVEEGLRVVLRQTHPVRRRPKRVKLPLIPAKPGQKKIFEGMTPEEIHKRLANLEAGYEAPFGR
jgi:hypothetical protein